MYSTNLRKVGGSVMLAVPPAFLDQLHLEAGATVDLAIDKGCLIAKPQLKKRYSLAELLAASDYPEKLSEESSEETREWLDAPSVGGEII